MSTILGHLQRELEALHAVESEHRVEDYLIGEKALGHLGVARPRADEELLVLEEGGELSLGVWYAPRVLEALRDVARDVGALLGRGLHTFCLALEGVSHFLYVTHRAAIPRPVSLLELEVQAEIDKFALAALHVGRRGGPEGLRELLRRLFEDVRYLPHLDGDAIERYRTANRLAGGYCRSLARHLASGSIDELLAELRRSYRLGAGEKLGHLAARAA